MSIRDKYAEMDVPAFHVTGWYDDLSAETQTNFVGMSTQSRSENARRWQKLVIGPWGHGVPRISDSGFVFGDVDFGKEVKIDFQAMSMKWFDYHLKGIDNGLDKEAPVKIFVMGANKWRDEREWPLKRARPTPYYLHSKGQANTRFGDGVLSTDAPANEPADKFRYDPRNPVPTYGGHGCCDYSFAAMGPLDQRVNQQRADVLVYSTPPLSEDTGVSGIVEAQLSFATDVTDTDFFVTLSDVYPDGKAIDITEGQARTRFRESQEHPTLLTPNKETSIAVKLWGTSNLFKKGHRIRVHITSSNFPRYARNLNSGKALGEEAEQDIRVATTVFHSLAARRRSCSRLYRTPDHAVTTRLDPTRPAAGRLSARTVRPRLRERRRKSVRETINRDGSRITSTGRERSGQCGCIRRACRDWPAFLVDVRCAAAHQRVLRSRILRTRRHRVARGGTIWARRSVHARVHVQHRRVHDDRNRSDVCVRRHGELARGPGVVFRSDHARRRIRCDDRASHAAAHAPGIQRVGDRCAVRRWPRPDVPHDESAAERSE